LTIAAAPHRFLLVARRTQSAIRVCGPGIKDALNSLCDLLAQLVILILWIRLKGVVGPEYAPLITGASITHGNSGNGALPIREPARGEDQNNAGQ
jgi:hypothetical protein